jgi:cystathionine beta-synthase
LGAKEGVPALVSVDPTTLVRDVLQTLRRLGISQLPVLAGKENVGSIQEEELLHATLEDQSVLDRTVRTVLGPPFPEVPLDASVSELLRRLKGDRALLVRDTVTGAAVGVLTRHDVLSFLSTRGASHAV